MLSGDKENDLCIIIGGLDGPYDGKNRPVNGEVER
jgi:hypothetical protein